ncbi:hypothetical protein Salat_2939400 [Sesamum alatum]|uniref:Uncharacterized protein n=1 Tax=Sesamum alatum TaxID=300844 RepID=A0AAE2C8H3_9LAMI|nr:hypothetical protein Salat_2939400 [Sesamum alatum]
MAAESNNLEEILRPFYQRASEAEDRLARLEATLAGKKESGNEELLKLVNELESKLETAKAEQVAEREKAMKEVQYLTAENAKLQYRIIHLVRALKEADSKLAANVLPLLSVLHSAIIKFCLLDAVIEPSTLDSNERNCRSHCFTIFESRHRLASLQTAKAYIEQNHVLLLAIVRNWTTTVMA